MNREKILFKMSVLTFSVVMSVEEISWHTDCVKKHIGRKKTYQRHNGTI